VDGRRWKVKKTVGPHCDADLEDRQKAEG
jgi:hypothetical protein